VPDKHSSSHDLCKGKLIGAGDGGVGGWGALGLGKDPVSPEQLRETPYPGSDLILQKDKEHCWWCQRRGTGEEAGVQRGQNK
jgi:hypothetical protein